VPDAGADAAHPNPALAERLARIYALNRYTIVDLGFRAPYLALLRALGNPHRRLPPMVHVAGTNGKGSTIAFMRAALERAGLRVHVYTSPHLVTFNERIVLAGQSVSDDTLLRLIDRVAHANAKRAVTFFEFTTALGFLAFSQEPADVLLGEVGMGGRLDCTNVVERPAACVITAIGMDHAEHLGGTLESIAREKAGIMKPGVPCVVAPQPHGAVVWPVLEHHAHAVGAPLIRAPALADDTPLPLPGAHQRDNAGAAHRALMTLSDTHGIHSDTSRKRFMRARWLGRLQKLDISDISGDWTVWLDGGHNADASQALAAWMTQDDTPVHLIIGMKADRDPAPFVGHLAPQAASVTYTSIPGAASYPFAHMRPWRDALHAIVRTHAPPGRILIAGSLYLAGAVLRSVACPS